LFNGNYYEEIFSKDPKEAQKKPHAKSYFDTYTLNVDLEALNDVDLDDKNYNGRYNMLDVSGLNYTIDSLYKSKSNNFKGFAETLYNRTSINALNLNIKPIKDSLKTEHSNNILDLFDTKTK